MFDENGERYGFLYNSTLYYYVRNVQGDVIRILNSLGTIVAKYEYDAWDKVLKVTNASGTEQTSATFIGNVNPIRYRGYYYDAETGFYYLQSRYYDPETCRFVNADEPWMSVLSIGSLLSKDLFAYCENNPVMKIDPLGFGTITVVLTITKDFLRDLAKNGVTLIVAIIVGFITTKILVLKPFQKIIITAVSTFVTNMLMGVLSRKITKNIKITLVKISAWILPKKTINLRL